MMMRKEYTMINKGMSGLLLLVACIGLTVAGIGLGYSEEEGGEGYRGGIFASTPDMAPVRNQAYASECGGCHFAYQPGWLPARSWAKIMATLDDHFGENAELSPAKQAEIGAYLAANAADVAPSRLSHRIMRSLRAGDVPLRISGISYIRREHRGIPDRMIAGNAKVGSRSNCLACHTQAKAGYFDEDGVSIPGFGRWDD
jgi:hypothetical protein